MAGLFGGSALVNARRALLSWLPFFAAIPLLWLVQRFFAEQLVSGYTSSSWRDAVAFGILILILLVKPSGLLGRGTAEKV